MRKFHLAGSIALLAACATLSQAQGCFTLSNRVKHYANSLAPYVVSPQEIVDRMLELADLKPGETLYDLGSGDGRILMTRSHAIQSQSGRRRDFR